MKIALLALLSASGLLGSGLAGAEAAPLAYIPNFQANTVTVVDTATNLVVGEVPVGTRPWGTAVHPAGTFVYVINHEDDPDFCGGPGPITAGSVSVVDTAVGRVVATVPVGAGPHGIAVHPAGTAVYVTNRLEGTVSVIDTTTHRVVATVPLGAGFLACAVGVAVHPAGTFVYVVSAYDDTVSVIETSSHRVVATMTPVGPYRLAGLYQIAVHPAGTLLYVTAGGVDWNGFVVHPPTIAVIDIATHVVVAYAGGNFGGLAVHPTGTVVYADEVTPGLAPALAVLDATTGTRIATVPTGNYGRGVAVHPTGAFVDVVTTDAVLVVDSVSHAVVATVPVASKPHGTYGTPPLGSFIGPLLPGLSLTLDGADVRPGDVVTLRATTYPGDRLRAVDAYVEVQRPDGTVHFLQADGRFSPDRRPVARDWLVEALSGEVARYTVEPGQPAGTYRLRGYFTEPGASTVVGLTANAAFTVGP